MATGEARGATTRGRVVRGPRGARPGPAAARTPGASPPHPPPRRRCHTPLATHHRGDARNSHLDGLSVSQARDTGATRAPRRATKVSGGRGHRPPASSGNVAASSRRAEGGRRALAEDQRAPTPRPTTTRRSHRSPGPAPAHGMGPTKCASAGNPRAREPARDCARCRESTARGRRSSRTARPGFVRRPRWVFGSQRGARGAQSPPARARPRLGPDHERRERSPRAEPRATREIAAGRTTSGANVRRDSTPRRATSSSFGPPPPIAAFSVRARAQLPVSSPSRTARRGKGRSSQSDRGRAPHQKRRTRTPRGARGAAREASFRSLTSREGRAVPSSRERKAAETKTKKEAQGRHTAERATSRRRAAIAQSTRAPPRVALPVAEHAFVNQREGGTAVGR